MRTVRRMKLSRALPSAEVIEKIRERADQVCKPDDALEFYTSALWFGCTPSQAEEVDILLTTRVMRARGAI